MPVTTEKCTSWDETPQWKKHVHCAVCIVALIFQSHPPVMQRILLKIQPGNFHVP